MKFINFPILSLFVIRICARGGPSDDGVKLDSVVDVGPSLGPIIDFDVVVNLNGRYPPTLGYDISYGVGVPPIPVDLIVCQAFKGYDGRYPVGKPFIKAPPGSQRFSKTPIYVGSIFCSDAAAVRAYVKSRPADGRPVVEYVPRPYVELAFGNDTLFTLDDVKDVLLDNSITPLTLTQTNVDFGQFIFANAGLWTCQLYRDKNATKKIGVPITSDEGQTRLTQDPNFLAVKVKAVRCRIPT